MMDVLKQWTLCIIVAAAAGTFACAVSPRGSVEKTVRTVAGIFVIFSVCAPLSQLADAEFAEYAFAASYDANGSDTALKEQMLESCKKAAEESLASVAEKHGVTLVGIGITAYIDENECIIIQDIQAEVQTENPGSLGAFPDDAEEILGVPIRIIIS